MSRIHTLTALLLAGSAALVATPALALTPIKNVIVMVADGSGYNTLAATRAFTGSALTVDGAGWKSMAQSTYPLRNTTTPGSNVQDPSMIYDSAKAWDTTPVAGNSTVPGFTSFPAGFKGYEWARSTYPDSANTMSAMMTGQKTYNNAVNVDGTGAPLLSLAEKAHALGKSAGVITTVEFSDATPAAGGGAHNIARANHAAIAKEMFGAGTLDVIAGTGNPNFDNNGQARAVANYDWMPADLWNDLKNGTNLSGANAAKWNLVENRAEIQAIANGTATAPDKLAMIAQAFNGTNEYRADAPGTDINTYVPGQTPRLTTTPSLWESTAAALQVLGKDKDGMFMMVEGGAVDRAMHADNTGRMIEEYIEFNQTVQKVMDWVNDPNSAADWSNTLLIVTADHDHNFYGPDGTVIPFQDIINNGAGNLPGGKWFGTSHSNNLIPLFAYGQGSDDVLALANKIDSYTDAQGRTFGRGAYTDQAELGKFLLANIGNPGAVPEPATWAMMIAGFGMVGSAMRRKARIAAIA